MALSVVFLKKKCCYVCGDEQVVMSVWHNNPKLPCSNHIVNKS